MATESPVHLSSASWAVPKRSDSAPPVIEGSWTTLTNLLGEHNLNNLNESEEEQLRSSPAYLDYYNSRVNLNPRLPPPLIKREGRHLLHRIFNNHDNNNDMNNENGNDNDNDNDDDDGDYNDDDDGLDVKRSVLSTHKEETEDEKSPTNKDELSGSISPPFEDQSAEMARDLDTCQPPIGSFTPPQNTNPNPNPNPNLNPSSSSSPSSSNSSGKSKPLVITPDTKPLVVTDLAKLEAEMKGLSVNFPKGLNVNFQNPPAPLPPQLFPQQPRVDSGQLPIIHQTANIPISNPFYTQNNNNINLPNFGPGLFYPQNINPNFIPPNPNPNFINPQFNLPTNYPLNPNFINPQILSPNFPPQSPITSFYGPISPSVPDPNFVQFFQNHPYQIANPYNSIKSPTMDPFSPNLRPVSLNPNPFRKIVVGGGGGVGMQNYQQAPVVLSSPRRSESNSAGLRGEFRNLGKFEDLGVNVKPFSFLEELKSNRNRRFELADIAGRIVEFSADQHGSRFIQQKLEVSGAAEKASVFNEILPHATSLMTDVFGNYVIQKFFEYGSKEQRRELANKLVGHILPLSLQMYGCRVIQKALEVIELEQKVLLVHELEGHEMDCVRDQNGNHVIQKCIECVPAQHIGFVVNAFKRQVAGLSMHPYGCRVIQRVLEHCTNDPLGQCIVDEILQSACTLAQDQYGNYVTQHVLEKGKPGERSEIIKKLAGQVVIMSQNKYASNVIEKCFQHGSDEERDLLICGIIEQTEGNDNLLVMMKDQYANYVVQKMLDTCDANQRDILLNRVKSHLPALRKYTYGKHIVARVDQLLSQGNNNVYGA